MPMDQSRWRFRVSEINDKSSEIEQIRCKNITNNDTNNKMEHLEHTICSISWSNAWMAIWYPYISDGLAGLMILSDTLNLQRLWSIGIYVGDVDGFVVGDLEGLFVIQSLHINCFDFQHPLSFQLLPFVHIISTQSCTLSRGLFSIHGEVPGSDILLP